MQKSHVLNARVAFIPVVDRIVHRFTLMDIRREATLFKRAWMKPVRSCFHRGRLIRRVEHSSLPHLILLIHRSSVAARWESSVTNRGCICCAKVAALVGFLNRWPCCGTSFSDVGTGKLSRIIGWSVPLNSTVLGPFAGWLTNKAGCYSVWTSNHLRSWTQKIISRVIEEPIIDVGATSTHHSRRVLVL